MKNPALEQYIKYLREINGNGSVFISKRQIIDLFKMLMHASLSYDDIYEAMKNIKAEEKNERVD